MASNINPQNINGAYPVAGQDNNSQGFRDNFTNIKTNFEYASSEITDLQSKAILKSALTGTTLNNNMGGSILSDAQLQDMSETRVALGSVTGAQVINYAAGPYYTLTTSGSVSISFTNFSPAGTTSRVRLQINVTNTGHTLTLPAAVSVGVSNIQGYDASVITFNQTGIYEFEFETNDGGSTVTIIDLNRNLDPVYYPSAEDLAPSAAIDLTVTTSYFTTAGAETATLADGAEGQIKNLVCAGYVGDMVVTVASAGWGGSGTITFGAAGRGCQLIFLGGNWWCIGNNGAVFA
jgi:hypothetical protein